MSVIAEATEDIDRFLEDYFQLDDLKTGNPTSDDLAIISKIVSQVDDRFNKAKRPLKYALGLTLDFTMLAQNLSKHDPDAKSGRPHLTEKELFRRYQLVTK